VAGLKSFGPRRGPPIEVRVATARDVARAPLDRSDGTGCTLGIDPGAFSPGPYEPCCANDGDWGVEAGRESLRSAVVGGNPNSPADGHRKCGCLSVVDILSESDELIEFFVAEFHEAQRSAFGQRLRGASIGIQRRAAPRSRNGDDLGMRRHAPFTDRGREASGTRSTITHLSAPGTAGNLLQRKSKRL